MKDFKVSVKIGRTGEARHPAYAKKNDKGKFFAISPVCGCPSCSNGRKPPHSILEGWELVSCKTGLGYK